MARYGDELTESGAEQRSAIKSLNKDFFDYILSVQARLRASSMDSSTMVDVAYLLREVSKYADDIRKEADKLKETLCKVCCMVWVSQSELDPTDAEPCVEGVLARGTPDTGTGTNLPERGSPDYVKFMRFLGFTQEQLEGDLVRPHWPHVQKMLSQRASNGMPTPPGIPADKTYPTFGLVSLRLKTGVTID